MSMCRRTLAACAALMGVASAGQAQQTVGARYGRPALAAVIADMDLTVTPDGAGLPRGAGSVAAGKASYDAKCASCHGAAGRGGIADRLTGGIGSLASARPVRTIASYWPYATTIFDYIRRAMPLTAPQSLGNDEVYGLVAYLLSVDGIVPPDATLDARRLAAVKMPNRDGFVSLAAGGFDGNVEKIAKGIEHRTATHRAPHREYGH